jgi:uncharacterized membrane protein YhhN
MSGWLNPSVPLVLALLAVFGPHLLSLRWPVRAYMLAVGTMVVGAFAVLQELGWGHLGAWVAVLGALFLLAANVFVAKARFVEASVSARMVGPPLYYAGQFLMATSVGLIG